VVDTYRHIRLYPLAYRADLVRRLEVELRRAAYFARVSPDSGAMLVQHRVLVLGLLRRSTTEVVHIGVLRHHAQCQLLPSASEHQRRIWLLERLGLVPGLMQMVIVPFEA